MVMRLLIDEMVPESVAAFLRTRGHDITLVRDVLLPGAADRVVAAVGDQYSMIVVTWNTKHFRPLAARAPDGTKTMFRKLGRISFKCPEPRGLETMTDIPPVAPRECVDDHFSTTADEFLNTLSPRNALWSEDPPAWILEALGNWCSAKPGRRF